VAKQADLTFLEGLSEGTPLSPNLYKLRRSSMEAYWKRACGWKMQWDQYNHRWT